MLRGYVGLGCCFSTKYFLTTPLRKMSAYLLFPIRTVSYFIILFRVHLFYSGESTEGRNDWLFFILYYLCISSLIFYFYFCLYEWKDMTVWLKACFKFILFEAFFMLLILSCRVYWAIKSILKMTLFLLSVFMTDEYLF